MQFKLCKQDKFTRKEDLRVPESLYEKKIIHKKHASRTKFNYRTSHGSSVLTTWTIKGGMTCAMSRKEVSKNNKETKIPKSEEISKRNPMAN